jgi:hypothetical protein
LAGFVQRAYAELRQGLGMALAGFGQGLCMA